MPSEATEGATAESTTMPPTLPLPGALQGGLGHTLVQMGGAVLLVVALILVLQKLANRVRPGWGGKAREGGIEIVSQRALGNRLALLVVETHGQTLLLGTSPQGITSLANLGTDAPAGFPPARKGSSATAMPEVGGVSVSPRGGRSTDGPKPETEDGSVPVKATPRSRRFLQFLRRSPVEAEAGARKVVGGPGSAPAAAKASTEAGPRSGGPGTRGMFRSIAARAVSRRPESGPRSALADLEEASRIAREARERDERLAREGMGGEVDLQEFERQFREKLRAIREKYPTLDEVEGRRA